MHQFVGHNQRFRVTTIVKELVGTHESCTNYVLLHWYSMSPVLYFMLNTAVYVKYTDCYWRVHVNIYYTYLLC